MTVLVRRIGTAVALFLLAWITASGKLEKVLYVILKG